MCPDANSSFLGMFDFSIAPQLLFYSYVPIILVALLLSFYILRNNKDSLQGKLLALISITFSLWVVLAIIHWTATHVAIVHFAWQVMALVELLIYVFSLYFVLVYLNKKDIPFIYKAIFAFLYLPIILLTPTEVNMLQFNITFCEPRNGYIWLYVYALEVASILATLFFTFRYIYTQTTSKSSRVQATILAIGMFLFLGLFTATNIIGDATLVYEFNLIGPLGMVFFLALITYMIVKYHAFNIKLAAAQALVVGLVFLIGSLFFFAEGTTDYVLITITFILASIGGYFLVRSVKKEIKQREEIELLAMRLEVANERLKELDKMKSEFVSIASHQLRGPITSIRGYASMLVEGSYGKLPERAKEVLEKLVESSKFMALSIEDYLNVSRIEAGNMKYELSDFNLREIAEKVVDEMRPVAMKKGLVLVYRSDTNGSNMVHADVGKTRQVIMNLIDNSIKYTPKGTITVVAHDDMKSKLMCITIQDTGIGMSKETIEGMFDKFVRAKNANSVNVTGTGLGLFVAKKMITQMNGRVWAESEGEGKGSTFHIELPLLSGKAGR